MLEFQGMIEMDGPTWAGNPLGQLSILDGGVKAQLVIGNHRLDGKVIKLDKPLLLIQKQQKPKDDQDTTAVAGQTGATSGKRKSKDHDMDEDSISQSQAHDRRTSFSSIPPSSPLRHHDDDDTMHSTTDIHDHPTGTDSGRTGSADPLAPSNIRETVQYDTVAVIRQKILFNTMPVPIIHQERRGLTVIKRGV
ncbi:hypothetical protein BGX29_007628 [Mortierella sp. GBA35]|nr:hypothetical protein BGX29_007628 [Mortierella sp. GBA35]KAG0215762.1 hypothetical protein BGX33_000872 [Mortierella sp. NVP41]